MLPLEDDSKEEREDSEGLLKTAKDRFDSMQKAIQDMLEIQKKKMDEAKSKCLSLSISNLADKPATKTGAGTTLATQKIIRIKDCKISGTITNENNRLPFSNVSNQIENALERGYSDADIVDGVIKSIAPNLHLCSYLEIVSSLSLSQVRVIFKSHSCEKSAIEAYEELANCTQDCNETPLNFWMRALKVRQQVLSSSQEPGSPIQYDQSLVQDVFLNSMETGLIDESIRIRLRPILQQQKVPHEQ